MPISIIKISDGEAAKLLALEEGHFSEFKGLNITPAKLSRTIAAFANAEGGELFVGVEEDRATGERRWVGFSNAEKANGHLQTFERLFPLGTDVSYDFLSSDRASGLVLKVVIHKTLDIKCASDGKVYLRRGAQNLPIHSNEEIENLKRDKGISSFEDERVNCEHTLVTNSEHIIQFMLEVVPTSEPEPWLRKQMLLVDAKPTVAGVILFADLPQAILPKRTGIKVYRYKTADEQGTRETLGFDPVSIEGCAYDQIAEAVGKTQEIIQSVRVRTPDGLQSVQYPISAVHEVITNAVLHRDYSIADDIHIRIFDNRVEVMSPGTLPGHVTVENILHERFARNPSLVRIINKFPQPPNKDVGEGLNTAFQAMREMKLKDPQVSQRGGYVTITLRHEPLASPEETILTYLKDHHQIVNKEARRICYIGSENKMKTILQRMVQNGFIELVPGCTRYNAAYRLPGKERDDPQRAFNDTLF